MLADRGLGYIIDRDTVVITSDVLAKEHVIIDLYPVGDLVDACAYESPGQSEDDNFPLIDLIESTVSPLSWTSAGGTGSNFAVPAIKSLICAQTLEVHNEVCSFLAEVRSARHAAGNSAKRPALGDEGGMTTRIYPLILSRKDPKAEDEYVAAIRNAIEPKVWIDSGAYVGKVPAAIVARCPLAVHRQIRDLLDGLKVLRHLPKPAPKAPTVIPIVG